MGETAAETAANGTARKAKKPNDDSSDERYTPQWLLDQAREFFGCEIGWDPCAPEDGSNPVNAKTFYTKAQDGLYMPWHTLEGPGWVNPPYSVGQVQKWGHKMAEEARHGAEFVAITQNDCSTAWHRFIRNNCDCRCQYGKRIGFVRPDGRALPGAKFGSVLWYFGRERRRFDRYWSQYGEVIHGLGPEELDAPIPSALDELEGLKDVADAAHDLAERLKGWR